MAQEIAINCMTADETLAMLRHQDANGHGYALALAQQANLTPEEAVQIFMAPYNVYFASQSYEPGLPLLAQQAQQNAAMLALSSGEENVRLERDGETWLITASLPEVESLERWGANMDYHLRWTQEQLRLVGDPKGINYKVWLDGNVQYIQLSLKENA